MAARLSGPPSLTKLRAEGFDTADLKDAKALLDELKQALHSQPRMTALGQLQTNRRTFRQVCYRKKRTF